LALFVDTSALIALLDAADPQQESVRAVWARSLADQERLVTSNYILVETLAVVQRRFGTSAVHVLLDDVAPVLELHWIDEGLHDAAVRGLRVAGRRTLSLVDCTSFELMRALGLRDVFTLDGHFVEQGFSARPRQDDSIHEP
jgi:uncharacterized protein